MNDADRLAAIINQRELAYKHYSHEEKQVYWAGAFVDKLFRDDRWDGKIDVARYREIEPDFGLFIIGIAQALADSTGEDRDDILKGMFIFDD